MSELSPQQLCKDILAIKLAEQVLTWPAPRLFPDSRPLFGSKFYTNTNFWFRRQFFGDDIDLDWTLHTVLSKSSIHPSYE